MTAQEFIKENQRGVLLNDYTLKDMEWFMTAFADYRVENTLNDLFNSGSLYKDPEKFVLINLTPPTEE